MPHKTTATFKSLLLLVLLVFNGYCFAQNYQSVDSIVDLYPEKFNSIDAFAAKVESDFKTDLEKVRAVYYWVSNNIRYNYKDYDNRFNRRGTSISYQDEEDYQRRLYNLERKYAERVLKSKKAICEGYSQLLRFTYEVLNIECEVISGFAKNSPTEIGIMQESTNHAWNAVKIDGNWKFIDATWSTGNDRGNPNEFNFNDTYFFIKPDHLIWSHFPEDEKWQLLEKPVTQASFFYKPIVYKSYFNSGLVINNDTSGIIVSRKNRSIKLELKSVDTNKNLLLHIFKRRILKTFND